MMIDAIQWNGTSMANRIRGAKQGAAAFSLRCKGIALRPSDETWGVEPRRQAIDSYLSVVMRKEMIRPDSCIAHQNCGKTVYHCTVFFAVHFTLHILQSTLCTFHFPLSTLHFTRHTLHLTLYTSHPALHTLHFTLYTLHSTLYTPQSPLHTLYITFPPNTPLFSHSTLRTPPHLILHSLHRYGHRARIYKTGEIKCFIKLFT